MNYLKQAVVSPVFNYEYSGDTYDKFTGKQLKQGSWNADSHTFDTVTVPVTGVSLPGSVGVTVGV